ncbi:hypothetical protein KLPN111929_13120 [Klebsiella pneumoniae]
MSQNTLKVHDLNEDAEFDENGIEVFDEKALVEEEPGNDSNLLIVFYVQIMPDDFVMQLHRF